MAQITLCDAEHNNALSFRLLSELLTALRRASDEPNCRVIQLAAEGAVFCAGLDLAEAFARQGQAVILSRMFADCLVLLVKSPQAVIVALGGNVSGGGLGLVAAADIIIATEDTTLMLPEVIVGMIPAIITPILLQRISPGRLRAMAISSRSMQATEAQAAGLVDELVSPSSLSRATKRQVARLLRSAPEAISRTKHCIHGQYGGDLETSIEHAFDELCSWMKHPQVIEGARAFSDGLAPAWFS